ncbi:hypothetical protein NLI96_g11439 [Meripilus lineatus]|uniref:BTB domain-containing protein n=1 Tax=Meripilus lineatus TaxID=2056292 RepID=A0AAD5URU4_9APHY|nr:hypothetical protein NLI96_g11439 [Physisporinus lineatus]
MPDSPCQTEISHPFHNTTSADVILRSVDDVDFYVHKHILSMASGFFRDLFSLEQNTQDDSSSKGPPSVISVTENSDVIEGILRLCYPVDEPEMTDISKVVDIFGAAHKYDIRTVQNRLRVPLRSFIDKSPFRVFAHACSYKLEDTAREAAEAWRSSPESHSKLFTLSSNNRWENTPYSSSYSREMADVPAGIYYRLLQYLRTGDAPQSFCYPTSPPSPVQITPNSYYCQRTLLDAVGAPFDINVHAIDGVTFPAHRMVLSMASAVLRNLIHEEGNDPIHLSEDACTVAIVLRACYPSAGISKLDMPFSLVATVSQAAMKYTLCDLESVTKQKLGGYISTHPLGVFLNAVHLEWMEGARAAALQLSRLPITDPGPYDPLLERTPTRVLHALLKFHFDYRKALMQHCYEITTEFRLTNYYSGDAMKDLLPKKLLQEEPSSLYPELLLSSTIYLLNQASTSGSSSSDAARQPSGAFRNIATIYAKLTHSLSSVSIVSLLCFDPTTLDD